MAGFEAERGGGSASPATEECRRLMSPLENTRGLAAAAVAGAAPIFKVLCDGAHSGLQKRSCCQSFKEAARGAPLHYINLNMYSAINAMEAEAWADAQHHAGAKEAVAQARKKLRKYLLRIVCPICPGCMHTSPQHSAQSPNLSLTECVPILNIAWALPKTSAGPVSFVLMTQIQSIS